MFPSEDRSSSSLRFLEEAIKVSFFCSSTLFGNSDDMKYKLNDNKNVSDKNNFDDDNNKDISNDHNNDDEKKMLDTNEKECTGSVKVVKRKLKSYARLPLQLHEFENVRKLEK